MIVATPDVYGLYRPTCTIIARVIYIYCRYAAFLTVLLIHRAQRDEEKCLDKYGEGYREYMRRVPYKIIPGVY